jgi:AraC-like DNA-binding protein
VYFYGQAMTNALLAAATAYMAHATNVDGNYPFPLSAGAIMTSTRVKLPRHIVFRPSLCVVVQGAKRLMLDDRTFDYAANQALVVALEVPALGHVTVASDSAPYIGIALDLDPAVLQDVLEAMERPPRPTEGGIGLFVAEVDEALSDSMTPLVKLLDRPDALPVLYPALMREIAFWLLSGPHGREIAKLARPDGHARRLGTAITLLRRHYDKPMPIDELAAAARMSPSSFYQHFKTLTSMTPLQYQKQLRLIEARRRMLADETNVEGAAFAVGYESASQFSREYARMFGTPPKRDIAALRTSSAGTDFIDQPA